MIEFNPHLHTLATDERLRLKDGVLYKEKISVRQNKCWIVRLFTRHQYSQSRILNVIHQLAQEKITLPLFTNYKDLIQRAQVQNQAFAKNSNFARFFQGKSEIQLKKHEEQLKQLTHFEDSLLHFETEGKKLRLSLDIKQEEWLTWPKTYQQLVTLGTEFNQFCESFAKQIPDDSLWLFIKDGAELFVEKVFVCLSERLNQLQERIGKVDAQELSDKVSSLRDFANHFKTSETFNERCSQLLANLQPVAAPFTPPSVWLKRGNVDQPNPLKGKSCIELGQLFMEKLELFDANISDTSKAQDILDLLEKIQHKLNKKYTWMFPRVDTLQKDLKAQRSPTRQIGSPYKGHFDLFSTMMQNWSVQNHYTYLKDSGTADLEEIKYYQPKDTLKLVDNIRSYFETSTLKTEFEQFELSSPIFGAINEQMYTVIQLTPKNSNSSGDKLLWNFLAHGVVSYNHYFAFHIPSKKAIVKYQFDWENPENSSYLILFHRPVEADDFSLSMLGVIPPELLSYSNENLIKDKEIKPRDQQAIDCISTRLAKAHATSLDQ